MVVLQSVMGRLLQRVLSQHFDYETDSSLSYSNLQCKTGPFNEKLAGQPFQLVHGHIRQLQVQLPQSLVSSGEKLVVTCRGALFLVRVHLEYDDDAIRQKQVQARQKQLAQATQQLEQAGSSGAGGTSTGSRIVDWLKAYLKDTKFLSALSDRVEISIEDVHVRVEDTANSCSFGLVFENMLVRQDYNEEGSRHEKHASLVASSVSQLGVYWNYDCVQNDLSSKQKPEHAILQYLEPSEINEALDRTIPRQLTASLSPAHTYLLLPTDGSIRLALDAGTAASTNKQQPTAAVQIVFNIPYLHYEVRDVSCWQIVSLTDTMKEYKSRLQYRVWRPRVSVREDPRAWWRYAATCIRYELRRRIRWSHGRFVRHYQQRQRYCVLYQQAREGCISEAESQELIDLENGLCGDLSVQDIVLFRLLVDKRIGLILAKANSGSPVNATSGRNSFSRGWFRRSGYEDEDYQQLLDFWVEFSETNESKGTVNGNSPDRDTDASGVQNGSIHKDSGLSSGSSAAAVSFQFHVETGKVTFYSPPDLEELKYLQQRFLDLTFTRFDVFFTLMKDFESMAFRVALHDYVATELRSNQDQYAVVKRAVKERGVKESGATETDDINSTNHDIEENLQSLVSFLYTKSSSHGNESDFRYGVQSRVLALELLLVPDCEWIMRLKAFVNRGPRFYRAPSKFWEELSMAHINSWASNRLGLLVKAQTAAAHRRQIDFDVLINAPVVRISDGEGNHLVVDLGYVRLKTEKLADVADSLLQRVSSHAMNSESSATTSFPWFNGRETLGDDESSIMTQSRLSSRRKDPWFGDKNRTGFTSTSADSVNFGASIRLEEGTKFDASYPDLFNVPEYQADVYERNMNMFFYDIFDMSFDPGPLTLETKEHGSHVIVSPMDLQVVIHKSILPTDHTLCRLKVRCTVEEIVLSITEKTALTLATLCTKWIDALSDDVAPSAFPSSDDRNRLPGSIGSEAVVEEKEDDDAVSSGEKSFDEDEFFDAAENNSQDHPLLDEHWIADSESVVDSETRFSLSRGGRNRRSSAASDVSSISETSTNRRKVQLKDGNYLSAENLARLEEEGGAEDSESDDNSFHSAISPEYLLSLERDLAEDIREAESNTLSLKRRITELRKCSEKEVGISGSSDRKTIIQGLRLELHRAEAELKVLRAAQCDLATQRQDAEGKKHVSFAGEMYRRRAQATVSRATTLLEHRKSRVVGGSSSVAAVEHSMTRNLRRDLLQFSFAVFQVRLQVLGFSDGTSLKRSGFVAGFSHCGIVLRQRVGETKVYVSIEKMDASHQEDGALGEPKHVPFIIGGVNYASASSLLPSRFPELISSSSMEEKLLRCAFEIRSAPSDRKKQMKIAKIRFVLGDLEFTLRPSVIMTLTTMANKFESTRSGASSSGSPRSIDDSPASKYYDYALRLSSVRIVVCDNEQVGAIAVTEISSRFVRSATHELLRDRSQLDLRCGNIQFIGIDDFETGKGVELVGKRDLYNPMVRLRFRHQLVPETVVSGWVTGLTVDEGENAKPAGSEQAYNVYFDVKFDSLSIILVPHSLSRMRNGIERLNGLVAPRKASAAAVSGSDKNTEKPTRGKIIRWRIDASLKKTSIVAQMIPETVRNYDESCNQEKLISSLAASFSMQPTSCVQKREILQLKLHDVIMLKAPGNSPILEPMEATLNVETKSRMNYDKSTRFPQLKLPATRRIPRSLINSSMGSDISPLTLLEDSLILVDAFSSRLVVNLVPSSVDLVIKLHNAVTRGMKPNRKEALYSDNADHPPLATGDHQSRSGGFSIGARVTIEGATLSLCRDMLGPSQQVSSTEKLVMLHAEDGRFRIDINPHASSFHTAILYGSVIDFTCKPGIEMISGGAKPQVGYEIPGSDIVVLSCTIKEVAGRAEAHFELRLGKIRILPLPSCVRGLFKFVDDLGAMAPEKDKPRPALTKKATPLQEKIRKLRTASFQIHSDALECVLSSKGIPKYLWESSTDPVSVVAIRLHLDVEGMMHVCILDKVSSPKDLFSNEKDDMGLEQVLVNFLDDRVNGSSAGVTSNISFRFSDFQILRTTIVKCEEENISFKISPPVNGEQRVTNKVNVSLKHQASFASFASNFDAKSFATSFSHSIQIESEFIDILVYAARSSGGLNEAICTTVTPILELVRNQAKKNGEKETRHDAQVSTKTDSTASHHIKDIIFNSPLVCAINVEGINLTLVPGGATRLTESPIAKFALLGLSSGFAMTPVSSDLDLLQRSNASPTMVSTPGVPDKHLLLGGWLSSELSASYNNRRLVVWEPLIEPWRFETIFGCDLSSAAGIHPVLDGRRAPWIQNKDSPLPSALDRGNAGRLRDFGRLLRSPFQNDQNTEKPDDVDLSSLIYSDVDFCYLVLLQTSKNTFMRASYSSSPTGPPLPSLLPGVGPIIWLRHFGYPNDMSHISKGLTNHPTVICHFFDSSPLNINFTGALIENVSEHLARETGESRGLAPHRIRNESGLVS